MKFPINIPLLTGWKDHDDKPIVSPPFPDFLLADPFILQPKQSLDRLWHLFAHGVFGMYHYTSLDGLTWSKRPTFLGWFRLRPFIYREKGVYYLFYEKLFHLWRFPFYNSRLELVTSTDLHTWSKPQVVISPSLSWHKTKNTIGNIGNPWIIKTKKGYRLYYSSGLVYLPECWFCEPKNIGYATSIKIDGPYTVHQEPLDLKVYPKTKYPATNPSSYLWAPFVRPIRIKGGYFGLLTTYYLDKKGWKK